MKVIIGSRQTGRTTECIKYCITHAEKLDNGEYKPSLLVVSSEKEKQRLIKRLTIDWDEAINNHLLKIITFADYINPRFTTSEFIHSVADIVIDDFDKCIATLNPNCSCINTISVLGGNDINVLFTNEMQKGVFYDRRVFR